MVNFRKALQIEVLWIAILLGILFFAVQSYFQDQFRRDFSFVLSNHLGTAHGTIRQNQGGVVQGIHSNEKSDITYPSLPSWLDVSLKADTFGGKSDARIFLHPFPASTHELEWHNLPRGKHLRLKYGFSDSALNHSNTEKMGVVFEVFNGSGARIYSATIACEKRIECPKGLQSADILNPFPESSSTSGSLNSIRVSVRPVSEQVNVHWFYIDGYVW